MPDTQALQPRAAELLDGSYRRLMEHCPALRFALPAPGEQLSDRQGWLCVAELTEGGAGEAGLDRLTAAEAARILAEYGSAPREHVAASRLLHHYLWSVCLLISGPWQLDRRVPRIRPQDLWIHAATGDLALRPGDFACLPGDGAAGLPGARVLAGEDELRAELRAAVAEHVTPLIELFKGPLKRGPRALWGMVTDDLVSGIWYLGRMLGEEDAAVRAATAVLPGGTPPFPGAADFRLLAGPDGRGHQTRTRLGCCLYYTIRPAEACFTCPRTDDAERLRRLAQPAG